MAQSFGEEHIPVLLAEVLRRLEPSAHGGSRLVVDGTLGAGGHAEGFLRREPDTRLLGIDRDPKALERAQERLRPFAARFRAVKGRYGDMRRILTEKGEQRADAILLDLGVSSMQLDAPERGFSYRYDAPLDMRMADEGESAAELIERLDETELAALIYRYGEERYSRRIARLLKREGEVRTTEQLASACRRAYPKGRGRIHPATRTFQALRIAVNDELGELERFLDAAPLCLAPGGRLAIISFHSLEDRIVKRRFLDWRQKGWVEILTKKPIRADEEETAKNPRASGAKLRVCEAAETMGQGA